MSNPCCLPLFQRPRGIRPATLAQLRGDPCRDDVLFCALRLAVFVLLSLRLFISQVDNPTSLENIETKVSIFPPRLSTCSQRLFRLKWLDEILEYCPGVKVCHPSLEL